jgi:hypothetical protein
MSPDKRSLQIDGVISKQMMLGVRDKRLKLEALSNSSAPPSEVTNVFLKCYPTETEG